MKNEYVTNFRNSTEDVFAILQLDRNDDTAMCMFMNYNWLNKKGMEPNPEQYQVVYAETLPKGKSLEDIYARFNLDLPLSFTGHCLSVSDIVALKKDGVVAYYFVDSIGFVELPDFHTPLDL